MLGIIIFGESANRRGSDVCAYRGGKKSGPSQGRKDWRNV